MTKPKILVTGATGKTGRSVVSQLAASGWPVRAVVHRLDARSADLERMGAEVVVADLFDAKQMRAALHGTQRAYYCPPIHALVIQSAVAFANAAQEAKLESIVGLSQWLASDSSPSLVTRQHHLIDDLFATLPRVAHTVVNPGFFAEYPYLRLIRYAAHLGLFPMPVDGDSRNAPPSNDDIARVVVAALKDPTTHAGKRWRPTGPTLLSVHDMATILGDVLGRRVRHVRLPMWLFWKAARMDGVSPIELSGLHTYLEEHSRGTFAIGAPNDHVLRVTGRPPEDFATIARRHAEHPDVRRSFGHTVKTLLAFMSVPMRRGFAPERFEREHDLPVPAEPRLSIDDPAWQREHATSNADDAQGTPLRVARA